MKVKKVTLVTVSFFIFSFVCCIVLGFVLPYGDSPFDKEIIGVFYTDLEYSVP